MSASSQQPAASVLFGNPLASTQDDMLLVNDRVLTVTPRAIPLQVLMKASESTEREWARRCACGAAKVARKRPGLGRAKYNYIELEMLHFFRAGRCSKSCSKREEIPHI